MKTIDRRWCFCGLLALLALSIVSCSAAQSSDYLRVKRLPPPQIVAEEGKAKTLPAGFIKRRLRLGYPQLQDILINDRNYLYITDTWFQEVMNSTREFIESEVPGIGREGTYPENYGETFVSFAFNWANISVARRYNLKASVLIGLIVAQNRNPWGDIPGDGSNRVYAAGMTADRVIIYDVYTGQSIRAADFPNLEYVTKISF